MLKYLINKPMLSIRICIWMLLFQEHDLEIIFKLGKANVGLDHLSGITTGEQRASLDDTLPDSYLFIVMMVDDQLKDIAYFLETGTRNFEYQDSARSYIGFRTAMIQIGMGTNNKLN